MRVRGLLSRQILAPAGVLFAVMTAHAVLETARDALFLARLGAHPLAWAYIAMAAVALFAVFAVRRWGGIRDPRRLLVVFLAFATIGTAILAALVVFASWAVFVLYVWTGLVATLVLPCFWTVLDRSLNVRRAKQTFAAIGAGGVLGALAGSTLAAALSHVVEAQHLVTAGASLFGVAAVTALVLAPHPREDVEVVDARQRPPAIASRRYVTLLVLVGLIATVTLTIGDLTFKRVLAERLAKEDLATTLGTLYAVLNVIGLVIQLAVTPRLLTKFGVAGALIILPSILLTSAIGFAVTGTWIAILALKLGDGGLRHSLHRVANEILFLAVPREARDSAKPVVDAVSHRGGQAAAALLVFAATSVGAGSTTLAMIVAVAAGAWLATIAFTRRAYVAQFRDMLRAGDVDRDARVPALDAGSIEVLTEALSSPDPAEALAALELLASGGVEVPPLVLYHPRPEVVHRALSYVDATAKQHTASVLGYLLEHSDPEIRAATLAAAGRRGSHRDALERALGDDHPHVRAAAFVALADDPAVGDIAETGIAALVAGAEADRIALASAILNTPSEQRFVATLYTLLDRREPKVMRTVLHVLARSPALADLDRMLPLLADPHVRGDVRRVFVATGHRGLQHLIAALDDPRVALQIRQHLPRTISRFRGRPAAAALVTRLLREPDGTTEYKILRALGRMRAEDPRLPIDEAAMRMYFRRAVADAARWATLVDGLACTPAPATPELTLIRELLDEKRRWAIEHAFRALGILHPTEGVRSVYESIASKDEARRAAAREVFEDLAPSELREALLAVIDDVTPERRRAHLRKLAPGPFPTHESLVSALLAEPSASLRCIVAYHVAERGLAGLRSELARLRPLAGPTLVVHAFDQAIERLDAR